MPLKAGEFPGPIIHFGAIDWLPALASSTASDFVCDRTTERASCAYHRRTTTSSLRARPYQLPVRRL